MTLQSSLRTEALDSMRLARRLSTWLLVLMIGQALMGLTLPTLYHDVPWIRATWFGNDWVTLVVSAPLLAFALSRVGIGTCRGALLWLGLTGYALYNYAFYLFGAALNVFFPLYVVAFVLASVVLMLALPKFESHRCAALAPQTPVRFLGAVLVFVGTGLALVWISLWAAYVFLGRPTPVEPEAFKLVAALDLSLMVPMLIFGGVRLWQRRPWGVAVSAVASIQGALYLLVLSVNSIVAFHRGLAAAPGELPIWGTLALITGSVAVTLLVSAGSDSGRCGR